MLQAIRFVRSYAADSKPIAVLASDGRLYVTKWCFRRGENRRLINEWLAHPILQHMGVAVPSIAVVQVSADFIRRNRKALQAAFGADFDNLQPGPVFASLVDESSTWTENMPPVESIANIGDFHAAMVADVFMSQGDKRQAIWTACGKHAFRAVMLDNANCFESKFWQFRTAPNAVFINKHVYDGLTAAEIDRLLQRIETMPEAVVSGAVKTLPCAWIGKDSRRLQRMVKRLLQRRCHIRRILCWWMTHEKSDCFSPELVAGFSGAANS